MAAINQRTDLDSYVTVMAHRDDLATYMDNFVQLTETMINYGFEYGGIQSEGLRTKEMEARLAVSFNATFYDLPADYIELIALEVEYHGRRNPLRQVSPQILDGTYSTATGPPKAYTIQGGELEFRPGIDPASPYTGELRYYAQPQSLLTHSANWVMTEHPNIYVYGMLFQIALFADDEEGREVWFSSFASSINGANKTAGNYVLPRVSIC